jgi:hypothetical protein
LQNHHSAATRNEIHPRRRPTIFPTHSIITKTTNHCISRIELAAYHRGEERCLVIRAAACADLRNELAAGGGGAGVGLADRLLQHVGVFKDLTPDEAPGHIYSGLYNRTAIAITIMQYRCSKQIKIKLNYKKIETG